ncbi:MAG: extracellular solute-binding protein, partial [Chitinophagales bacterium]
MHLRGITWDHPRGYEPLVASSALYEKTFGHSVSWQKRSLANFGDQSIEELSSQFDLLIVDHPHAGIFWKSGCLIPLNEWLPENMLEKLASQSAGPSFFSYNYKGKQWALPVDAAMQAAALRPDLMGNLTIPESWKEVFELSEILKHRNLSMGMALCPTDCLCTFLTLTAQL